MYVYMYVRVGALRGQKKASDPSELELGVAVADKRGCWYLNLVTAESSLQSPGCLVLTVNVTQWELPKKKSQ